MKKTCGGEGGSGFLGWGGRGKGGGARAVGVGPAQVGGKVGCDGHNLACARHNLCVAFRTFVLGLVSLINSLTSGKKYSCKKIAINYLCK